MTAWSRERPTQAGWYWWRRSIQDPEQVLRIVVIPMLGLHATSMFDNDAKKVSVLDGEWQGPLEPKE